MKLNKTDESVVAALKDSKGLTLAELSEKSGQPSKKVFKCLRKLFEHEFIDSNARKYRLIVDPDTIKEILAKKSTKPEESKEKEKE
jgi:sugar-specific transcriptional regulator TrmB